MARKIGPRLPSGMFTKMRKPRAKRALRPTAPLTRAINTVISRKVETKRAVWYSGLTNNGAFSGTGYVAHNPLITSNATDILRLIPYVKPGTGNNQRIGDRIVPKSLMVTGALKLSDGTINGVNAEFRDDVVVVLYVLQHKSLKSYSTLTTSNDFLQMLSTGEQDTTAFDGTLVASQLPVEDSAYRLLAKKKIRLRYAGAIPGSATGVPTNAVVSVANAHSYYADFSFNLTKHLPAQFLYRELSPGVAPLPDANDPTNSSIFMCCGFYNMDGQSALTQLIDIQWSSQLKYKDY